MFRKATALATLFLTMTTMGQAMAEPAKQAPPRLIVAISVDQFSADLFDEYRQTYSGGLKRLLGGAVFPRGYHAHAMTETCPGHATLLTGAYPAHTGIIANGWIDQGAKRADKAVYCAEDEDAPGSSSKNYQVSVAHLRVPTLAARMKKADAQSRVVSVSGKDRAAVMMAGDATDSIWWWRKDRFESWTGTRPSPAVSRINAEQAAILAADRAPMDMPDWCAPRAGRLVLTDKLSVGDGRFARKAGDSTAYIASPEQDAGTLDLARALIAEQKLGQRGHGDLIAIGLSATDKIGHAYGTEGAEQCIQVHALDMELGKLFDWLDAQGIDYAVMLSADHGGQDLPERQRMQAVPDAERVATDLLPDALDARLRQDTGLTGTLIHGDDAGGWFWLDSALTPDQRDRVSKAALALWRAHPQVAAIFTAADLAARPMPVARPDQWELIDRARANFDPERSGDFIVLLRNGVTNISRPKAGGVATHGSPWDYDRRVPILFWRKGMTAFEQPQPVRTVDIAPTLAAMLGIAVPAGEMDGRCLDLDPGAGSTCP